MHNISDDLVKLTTIAEEDIAKFFRWLTYCCGDAVLEDNVQGIDISEIDIGIGTLYIKQIKETEELAYKFVPSPQFQTILKTALSKKISPVSKLANKAVRKNFMQAYKNLC